MKYIISTMTSSVAYAFYDNVQGLPIERHKIFIAGGRGIASTKSGFGEMTKNAQGQPIWTAKGLVTSVNDSDFEQLKDHPVFKKHQARGLVRVLEKDITGNHKAVAREAASMESDGFGPMNSERLGQKIKVSTQSMRQEDEFRI